MSLWKANVLLVIFSVAFVCRAQQYDFGAEISRQCLVPDPVGLLDCVENKVTLPYLTSWVDCTNSLGENVRTSADIINYRCKSVWEGKGVIPEVFYIKDCVIEKTGLPAKNVSAEVLGAYKECESTPNVQGQQRSLPLTQGGIKTAPIQQQQINTLGQQRPVLQTQPISLSQGGVKTAPIQQQVSILGQQRPMPPSQSVPLLQGGVKTIPVQQQQIVSSGPAVGYSQQQQPIPRPPPQQQPFSQQYFVIYPRPPLPGQQLTTYPNQANGQLSYVPQSPQVYQQQVPVSFETQQQIPISSFMPQVQQQAIVQQPMQVSQQAIDTTSSIKTQQPAPSGPYSYQFQIRHS
ncbi:uncharacterized protein CDAR_553051 [Caerostris darwini]|uniref:Uncharacterized protein n=1 Tax=Caerostris darwini TaxID=1538125 RepID=A0AAV4WAI8_9ARAC|nr:uncharacterized protein CDAR_553051 [Caerostris darwini]